MAGLPSLHIGFAGPLVPAGPPGDLLEKLEAALRGPQVAIGQADIKWPVNSTVLRRPNWVKLRELAKAALCIFGWPVPVECQGPPTSSQ